MTINKKFFMFFVAALILTSGISVSVFAESGTTIEVSSDVAVNSKYIWRGFTLDTDPVMQQGIYFSAKGFTAGMWGSFDVANDDSFNSEEVDYAIDYTRQIGKVSLSVGNTYYDFPQANTASKEFYVGAGLDMALSPNLIFYHDYGKEVSGGGDGDYIVLGLSHSVSLGEGSKTLDLSGHVGYNNELFIVGKGIDAAVGMGLNVPLTEKITFSPNINYSVPFGDLEDVSDGNQKSEFYGGCTFAFGF